VAAEVIYQVIYRNLPVKNLIGKKLHVFGASLQGARQSGNSETFPTQETAGGFEGRLSSIEI